MANKVWKHGKWVSEGKKGWGGGWKGQHTTKGGKILVDWACGICDLEADPAYLGNYANQSFCPRCKTEKRLACHMTMETRRARIKAGTLKPKAQARAEREARKNGSQAQTTKDNIQPVVFDAEAADAKFHAKLLDDFIAEKITQAEMKELRSKGRPPESNSQQAGINQKTGQGQGVVGVGGGTNQHRHNLRILTRIQNGFKLDHRQRS